MLEVLATSSALEVIAVPSALEALAVLSALGVLAGPTAGRLGVEAVSVASLILFWAWSIKAAKDRGIAILSALTSSICRELAMSFSSTKVIDCWGVPSRWKTQ